MSQTLTYVIGGDRRANVDNIQDFKVDFGDDNQNWVQARQFERGMRQVFVNVVNEDNTPFDLTGCNVWFEGWLPKTANGDFRVIDSDGYVPLDPSAGKFRFDMPGQAFTIAGSYRQAFFRIVKNGNSVTTLEFDLDILADKVIDGLVPKDWIGPFEQIADQLVDDLQKHTDSADKIIADFQQKVTDLVNQLNQQGSTTTSMLTELQNRITDLETKIKQDGLFTQAEADQFKQSLDNEMTSLKGTVTASFNLQGLNVKNYGAVGDGKTDNHDAILAAIKDAKDTGVNHIYFPAGKYLTSNVNVEVESLAITGADRMSTTIISNQAEPLFSMKCDSMIRDLGFHSDLTTDNVVISIDKRNNDVAYWNITLQNLRFDSMEYPDPTKQTVGHWTMRPFWFNLNNLGLWDVTIRDCSMQYVYAGLTVDTTNSGWLTGSLFDNLVVKGFTHHAYGLISSNNTSRQITQCSFTNLDAQVLYETTGDDAAGYIISGSGNNFDNLRLFNDGTYTNHAIELRYFGGSQNEPQMPTFGYGSTAMNSFKGGTLEGDIYDPDKVRDLQHFDHVQLIIVGDNGSQQMVNVNDPIHENLLSKRGFLRNIVGDLQENFPSDSKIMTGADKYGQFIDIEMVQNDGSFDYLLSEPASTVAALQGNDYSIGIRFRNMNPGEKVAISAYLEFNGKDSDAKFTYSFDNPSIQGELQEFSWIYKSDPDYFNSLTDFSGKNACKFYIPKGMHIRVYAVYLCSGRAIDFNRVTDDCIINEGFGEVAPNFPGVSLNAITKKMIRYAGRYIITESNQPADMPADLKAGATMIDVIPGNISNQGVIKLFNLTANILYMTSVYGGSANGWIKLQA